MELIGLGPLLGGTLTGILDRQSRGDDDYLTDTAEPVGLQHHATQARVEMKPRELAAKRGQRLRG